MYKNNDISEHTNLITGTLHRSLVTGKLHGDVNPKKVEKIYMVIFKVLNYKSRTLVYNYISYPDIFSDSLLRYLMTRNIFLRENNIYQEPGHFLCILEKSYFADNVEEGEELKFTRINFDPEHYVNELYCSKWYNNPDYIPSIFKLIYYLLILKDIDSMSQLLDLALNDNYKGFIKEILGSLRYYGMINNLNSQTNVEPFSIINGCIFIVRDLEGVVSNLRKNYNVNVNTGPQSLRGEVNSMNNSLSILDMHYRDSLYYHIYHHSKSCMTPRLHRSNFSYQNIHMNMGGVRFCSTFKSFSSTIHVVV